MNFELYTQYYDGIPIFLDTSNNFFCYSLHIVFSLLDITFKTSPLLQFDAAHTSHCVELSVVDDDIVEGRETVIVMLDIVSMTHPFYIIVEPAFLKVTVLDNDGM